MTPGLVAIAVLLGFGAVRELAPASGDLARAVAGHAARRLSGGRADSIQELGERLGLPRRLERAGLEGRLEPRAMIALKAACAGAGVAVALAAMPAVATRTAVALTALLAAGGFVAPDALVERRARRRQALLVAALPDALDMLAVGSASGRDPSSGIADLARGSGGALGAELARVAADLECGMPMREAIDGLRRRVPGPEVGALAAALARSRTHGSPLAHQLHQQAAALRRDARRRIEERAARAAPKIQLVIALVLVPSVLMAIAAALIAHSETLLAGW